MTEERKDKTPERAVEPLRDVAPVAVIEIGTTSVRMAVAQVDKAGKVEVLESLLQAVSLGKDTFTKGFIEQETTEACVHALRSFRNILREYGIADDRQISAVATSAVREAANRDLFLDRLFIATDISVRAIDEAEVSRFTYLAVHPLLDKDPVLKASATVVVEVGGGSTEVLVLNEGRVENSLSHRMGSLRLIKMLEDSRAPTVRLRRIMESHVDRAVSQIVSGLPQRGSFSMLALGSDARFAAGCLVPDGDKKGIIRLPVAGLSKLTDEILGCSINERVSKYGLSYPEAETLGPALLMYVGMAQALKLKQIAVGAATLRDGILSEMATHGSWTEEFREQIVNSALEIGRKYRFDRNHAQHVADLSRQLFRALQGEHRLDPRDELILVIAALLHEIGGYVSIRSHHKHSMYLIMNSDLFGMGGTDMQMAALIARYHRRAMPNPMHDVYDRLDREDRIAVAKMAAILRVADALDRGHVQRRRNPQIAVEPGRLIVTFEEDGDLTLEQHGLTEKGQMFERVYGMKVLLRRSGKGP